MKRATQELTHELCHVENTYLKNLCTPPTKTCIFRLCCASWMMYNMAPIPVAPRNTPKNILFHLPFFAPLAEPPTSLSAILIETCVGFVLSVLCVTALLKGAILRSIVLLLCSKTAVCCEQSCSDVWIDRGTEPGHVQGCINGWFGSLCPCCRNQVKLNTSI